MRTRRYRLGDRLRPLAMFRGCPDAELAAADQLFTEVRFSDGHDLIRSGEIGCEFFVVRDGEVVVKRARELGRVGAGEFVGEVALLDRTPRNADVRADGPVVALVQGRREFRSLLHAAPTVFERIAAAAEDRR